MQERELIERIRRLTGPLPEDVLQGIGDDCAVIKKNNKTVWLVTMDTLVESVHFDLCWHPPALLGRKAISVNVSDIAAMGGRPCFVFFSMGLPENFSEKWVDELTQGLLQACSDYGCMLLGGDTVCSPGKVVLTVTVIGEMAVEHVLYRHGARVGDVVWVSGFLGRAAAGLDLFRAGENADSTSFKPLLQAHLDPRARVELAGALAKSGRVHAMMDLSDGLATDLSHLCRQSNVGARIVADQIPGQGLLKSVAKILEQRDSLQWMISGGEDYEMLFTSSPADTPVLSSLAAEHGWTIYPVGTIVEGSGVVLIADSVKDQARERSITYQGYDHFT